MGEIMPTVVEKAIKMLNESEALANPEDCAKAMMGAIIILKAYLQENPASEHLEVIETRIVTHLCKHTSRLKSHGEPDTMEWFHSFALFVVSGQERMTKVFARQPELQPWYDVFMQSRQLRDEIERWKRC